MKTTWYFPRVSLERGLIVPMVEEKPLESTSFLRLLGLYEIQMI